MKKSIFLLAVAAVMFAACENPTAIDPKSLYISEQEVSDIVAEDGGRLYTLNEFVDSFMTEIGNFYSEETPYRTRATNGKDGIYLFSIDTLPSTGAGIYIRGRVITEDHAGNFYKSMVIQQVVNGEQQALRLSVDASSVSGQYAIGQEILIRVNGFAIGRYANQPQLCVPSYNNNIYANNAEQKVGWAPGRIPLTRFQKATHRIGMPEKSHIQIDEITIADIVNISTATTLDAQKIIRQWDGKLVCLNDVWFTGQQENNGVLSDLTTMDPTLFSRDNSANVFAPSTGGVGFPRARVITDGINNTLVANSEYVKFAHYYLPGCDSTGVAGASNYKGSVTGILGYYRDNAGYDPDQWDWSITLRSLSDKGWGTEQDLKLFNSAGEAWIPQEYKPE